VVEGEQLLSEAIRAQWSVGEVFVDPDRGVSLDLAGLEVHELKSGVLERVATTETPQAVIAVIERREWAATPLHGWLLVLDRLADPGNVGTLIRSAEAFGACAVVCTVGTAEAFSPKAIRASAGAIFHVPVLSHTSLESLRDRGFRLIGTTSHGDPRTTSVDAASFNGDIAVVLGNEAHGMDAHAPVDAWVSIPHVGRSESLNVAMAGTVMSYVVSSRRGHGDGRTSVS
jgi:TrmH family RNA methyltransferase